MPGIEMIAITNGVHTRTWACADMSAAYDRFLSWPWRTAPQRARRAGCLMGWPLQRAS
jgi:glucan phosphorylase